MGRRKLTSREVSSSLFVYKAAGAEVAGRNGDEEQDERNASNNAYHHGRSESHNIQRPSYKSEGSVGHYHL